MIEYMLNIHYETAPQPCDMAAFYALCDRPDVLDTCQKVKLIYEQLPGNPAKRQLRDAKNKAGKLKKTLPALLLQGTCNGLRRSKDNAKPNGWVMMDIDHIRGEPPAATWARLEPTARRLGAALAHITPSGQGLRIVLPWPMNCPNLTAAQFHYARELGLKNYDACVKDHSRLSFVVPRSYLLLVDERLFGPPPTSAAAYMAEEIARGMAATKPDGRPLPPSPQFPPQLVETVTSGEIQVTSDELQDTSGELQDTSGELQDKSGELQVKGDDDDRPRGSFDGVPMERIVEELLIQHGKPPTGPVEGDRNNTLYLMARDLRYLCDFSPQRLAEALPRWGLEPTEAFATLRSAIGSPRNPSGTPRRVQRLMERLKHDIAEEQALAAAEQAADPYGDPADPADEALRLFPLDKLPPVIADMARLYPPEFRPAAVMASLPILGTLATRLRATYLDGRLHSPSFITCIVAPQASGKSFASDMAHTLLAPIEESDRRNRAIERDWMEKRRRCKGKAELPPDPKAVIRIISASASNSMLLKRMDYAAGRHLFTLCDEIDTLARANRAGAWSQKDDLLRQAFDNSTVGQDYISDDSWTASTRLFYNLLLCGTPGAVAKFFNDVEGGLVSRVCFARLPDRMGLPLPRFSRLADDERQAIDKAARRLMADSGPSGEELTCELPLTLAAIERWSDDRRREYMETQTDTALEVFRRRAAVIGFRAGLVAYALNQHAETKLTADFAANVATHVLDEQTALFGQRLNDAAEGRPYSSRRAPGKALFSQLPATFGTADVAALRQELGLSASGTRMMIQRWQKAGMAEKTARGTWKRIPSG